MIMCYNLFIKNKTPKFLEATLRIFETANHAGFLTKNDLDIFISNMQTQLEKDRPVGSSYVITDYKDATRVYAGQINIERKDVLDSSLARFQYSDCAKVLRWTPDRDRFINVIYRLED